MFLLWHVNCGCSLEPPHRDGFRVYLRSVCWAKRLKNIKNVLMKTSKMYILHGQVFVCSMFYVLYKIEYILHVLIPASTSFIFGTASSF